MANILPLAETQFVDANGAPLTGGSVYFYVPGTLTPKDTYQNSTASVLNTNPVILDSAGRAIIWGNGQYRQIVLDSLGNTVWDQVTSTLDTNNSYANVTAARAISTTTYAEIFIYSSDGGWFYRDSSDKTSAENGGSYCGTIIRSVDYATNGVWKRSYSGAIAPAWFGIATSSTDNSGAYNSAIASNLGSEFNAPGTFAITSPVTLTEGNSLQGTGRDTTIIHNTGTGNALQTPVSTPGGAKSFYMGASDLQVNGTNVSTPAAAALLVQQTGPSSWDRLLLKNHQYLVKMEGAVGTTYNDVECNTGTYGVTAGGINSLDATTATRFNDGRIESCTYAINNNGFNKGLHFSGTIIESCTNLYIETSGSAEDMRFNQCWLEANTTYDLGTSQFTAFNDCYFAGDISITGGYAVKVANAYVTGTTNNVQLQVASPIADVSLTGSSWTTASGGVYGALVTMPTIGSAQTVEDRYAPSSTAESMLFMQAGSPILGWSDGFTNLMPAAVSNAGTWGNGTATVTTGQTDIWGGTTAVLLTGSSDPTVATSYKQTGALSGFTSGQWYCYQIAVKASTAGNIIGLRVNGLTLNKFIRVALPDTNWRVLHMMFKADQTTANFSIYHGGGCTVHAVCVGLGATLRPFIPYAAVVPYGFVMEFGSIVTYGASAPVSGTWRVGDRVLNSSPTAGGTIGLVCTAAGTPGTWKTYGSIAP